MDCTFKTEEGKFNFRVGAAIYDGKRVLFTTDGRSDFYNAVGGRVQFGETTENAVLREIREELGVDAEIDRLYSITQKFFECGGVVYHEIEFLYLIKPFDFSRIDYNAIHCDGDDSRLVWLDADKEPDMPYFPKHMFEAVTSPCSDVKIMTENELMQ